MNEKVMKRVQEHYDKVIELGFKCIGCFLCGSQNYKLDIEGSDVDTKAIVLPKFEDIVLNKPPVSCTHVMDNGEHIDIKDIRLMFNEFKKANINFVELLFTEYKVINEKYSSALAPIFEHNEEIARYNPLAALKCANGQVKCKYKELQKEYSGKKCSNILRFELFMMNYIDGKPYLKCIVPCGIIDTLKLIKSESDMITRDTVLIAVESAVKHCEVMLKEYEESHEVSANKEINVLLNKVIANIMYNWLKKDMFSYMIFSLFKLN